MSARRFTTAVVATAAQDAQPVILRWQRRRAGLMPSVTPAVRSGASGGVAPR